jgi:thiosulfate/3-mercaptopyruvate sulfurtransferase
MPEPQDLIATAELEAALGDPALRIYDCTTYLNPAPPGSEAPYLVCSGRQTFEAAHIPGAAYLDLQGTFSDQGTRLRFMMPPRAQLEAAFSQAGVDDLSRVVLYSIGSMMWATRFWWMLKSLGFDRVAVLEGGFDKWRSEGRPVATGPGRSYPPATFRARERSGYFVDKAAVLAALDRPDTVIVDALAPSFHRGEEPSRYGRPGRIPGSVNVPAASLVGEAGFTSPAEAAAKFAAAGVTKEKRVICYCGGGISATIDLFQLKRLGFEHALLYDGSLGEWAKDPSLPIERG